MFTINDLKQTRFYQDVRQEGFEEGIQRMLPEWRSLLQRQLTRKLGQVSIDLLEAVQSLSPEQLNTLGEALFDFETPADFEIWLTENTQTDGDRPTNSLSEEPA